MITSLHVVGSFLSQVGYQMLIDMYTKYDRNVFYPKHQALRIDVVPNNSQGGVKYHTIVERTNVSTNKQELVKFVSKHVVLASGGK